MAHIPSPRSRKRFKPEGTSLPLMVIENAIIDEVDA